MTKTKKEQWGGARPCEEGCTCSRHATMSHLCNVVNPVTGVRCVKKRHCKGMCAPHYKVHLRFPNDPCYTENNERLYNTKSNPNYTPSSGCKNDAEDCVRVMRSVGLNPVEEYPDASTKWKCECMLCGKPTAVKYRHVKQGIYSGQKVVGGRGHGYKGYGCKRCVNPRLLSEEEATARALAKGLQPLEPYVDCHTPWKMRCLTCNQPASPRLSGLDKQGGCLTCGRSSNRLTFHDKPTTLYLMTNPQKKALKVGIAKTSRLQKRTSEHKGFKMVKVWHFKTGEPAWELEQTVLLHWRRDLGSPPKGFLAKGDMYSGHEETASTRKVGLRRTIDYIEALI